MRCMRAGVAVVAMLVAVPTLVSAQQPEPLSDEILISLTGEWEGTWERPDGEYPTSMTRTVSLDGQFIVVEAVLGFRDPYKGMGTWTRDQATGRWVGRWFDNYRRFHTGEGSLEGNKLTMQWTTWGGHTRIIEKVDDNTMTLTVIRPCASYPPFCEGSKTGTFAEIGTYHRKK